MLSNTLKRRLAILTAIAGLLVAAGPAAAQGATPAGLIAYNGHAGLGAGFAAVSDGAIELAARPATG
jgi:hypothetical protein